MAGCSGGFNTFLRAAFRSGLKKWSIINSAEILLQKNEIDLFVAQDAVENACTKLRDLKRTEAHDKFLEKTKEK